MDLAAGIFPNYNLRPGASLSTVHQTQEKKQEFSIITQDGDAVKITISKSKDYSGVRYNSRGSLDDASSSASVNLIDSDLQGSISVEIEGDLSEREQREIKQAITLLQKAHSEFDRGLETQSANRIDKIAHLDSIAQVNASFSEENDLSVTGPTSLYA